MSETPILDLEEAPPERVLPWLPKLIGLSLGLAIGAVLILEDQGRLPNWHWPACNGLMVLPALYVAIAIHELGHLIAGRIVGLDAGGISVGALVFTKSGKNWVVRFDRRMGIGGFFKPLTTSLDFHPSRFACFVAGGPLASLVVSVVCGIVSIRYGSGAWDWVGTLFWVSLLLLILSAAPYSSGLNKSDGGRLWQIIFHPQQARRWGAIVAIQSEEAKSLRPREWNLQLFNEILDVGSSASEFLYCQLLAYYRRLDEGCEVDALKHLEGVLASSARVGKRLRHALFLEAASASAIIRKRPIQARRWFERACKLQKPESPDVVEAAIAMCEGRYEEAAASWKTAIERLTRKRLDSGLIRFAKGKWAMYEAVCRAHQG